MLDGAISAVCYDEMSLEYEVPTITQRSDTHFTIWFLAILHK